MTNFILLFWIRKYVIKITVLFVLFILVFISFHPIFLHPDRILYPPGDLVNYSFWKKFLVEFSFHSSLFPLWNPFVFSGIPFISNPSLALFYPPNILYFLFPIDNVFGFMFAIDCFLYGLFTYIFTRTIKISRTCSIFSAACAMLSGTFVTRVLAGHIIITDTFIWLPLILTFYELGIQNKKFFYVLLSVIPIVIMLFAGHPQVAFYAIISSLIYFSVRLLFEISAFNGKFFIWIMYVSVALLFSILICSINILPMIEYTNHSGRSHGVSFEFASDYSLPPKQLISFIFPFFFGNQFAFWGAGNLWELNGYIGIIPLFLTLVSLLIKRNKYIYAIGAIALVALLISVGKYFPLYHLLYSYIPGFDTFRAPSRFLIFYTFSVSICAAFGIDFCLKHLDKIRKFARILLPITGFLALLVLLAININGYNFYIQFILKNSYAQGLNHSELYHILVTNIVVAIFIVLFFLTIASTNFKKYEIALFNKFRLRCNLFTILTICLAIIDLTIFGKHFIQVASTSHVFPQNNIISEIKKDKELFRVFDFTGTLHPILGRNFVQNVTGQDNMYLSYYKDLAGLVGDQNYYPYEGFLDFKNIQNTNILKLLNVKYVILNPSGSKNEPNNYQLQKIDDTLPRAFMVGNAEIVNPQQILSKMNDESFNPKELIYLEKNEGFPLKNNSPFQEITINSYTPNKIVIKTSIKKDGYLVLSDTWYPEWKAYDNNKQVRIMKTNYALRSIYLKKGYHEVIFNFDPDSYKSGALISGLSLLAYMVLLFSIFYKDRKRLFVFKK